MVQLLLRQEVGEVASKPADPAAVEAYYRAHLAQFVRPERLRLMQAAFGSGADAAQRAAAFARRAQQLPARDFDAFVQHARERGAAAGALTSRVPFQGESLEELTAHHGAAVARAAEQLREPGAVSGPLETPSGVVVLKLQDREPSVTPAFEQLRPQLSLRLEEERRDAAYAALLERAARDRGYQLHAAALAKLRVDRDAPAVDSPLPAPAMLAAPRRSVPPAHGAAGRTDAAAAPLGAAQATDARP
jgi:peptidyl-prolyl cis-trans isomerase C